MRLYSERYFTFDGGTYEGTGLPPHYKVSYDLEDLERESDTVLEAALDHLRSKRRQPPG